MVSRADREVLYEALRAADEAAAQGDREAEKDADRLSEYIQSLPPEGESSDGESAGVTRSIADSILELGTAITGLPANIAAFAGSDPVFPTTAEMNRWLAERGIHSGAGVDGVGLEGRTDAGRFAKTASDFSVAALPAVGAVSRASRAVNLARPQGLSISGSRTATAGPVPREGFVGTAGSLGREVLESAARNPRAFQGSELVAAGSAGVGAGLFSEVSGNPENASTGALIFGVANPATTVPIVLNGGGKTIRAVHNLISRSGDEQRASQIVIRAIEENGGDPEAVVAALLRAEDVDAPSAIKSGDEGLIALQRWLAQKNPDFNRNVKSAMERATEEMDSLIRRLRMTGDPQAIRTAAALEKEMMEQQADEMISVVQRQIDDRVANLGTDATPQSTGEATRRILDEARDKIKDVEAGLWNNVPRDVNLVAANTGRAWKEVFKRYKPEVLDEYVPGNMQRLLERYKRNPTSVTSGDLKDLRTLLRSKASDLRSGDNPNRISAKTLEDIAAQVELDMAGLPGYDEAVAFSRIYHNKFSQAFPGKAQAKSRSGSDRIAPESTMERAFGGGSTTGERQFREIDEAAKLADDVSPGQDLAPQARVEQEKFLRSLAERFIKDDGTVKSGELSTFIKKNKVLLDRFPGLRSELMDARRLTDEMKAAQKRSTARLREIERSAISEVTGAEDPVSAVGRIISGKTPEQGIAQLAKAAKSSGEQAVAGLRTAILQNRWNASSSFANFEDNLAAIMPMLRREGVIGVDESARLSALVARASKMEMDAARAGGRAAEMADPVESEYIDTLVRTAGARFGATLAGQTSGATLVAAAQGSKLFRRVLETMPFAKTVKILEEAALNPRLMADLVQRHKTPEARDAAAKRIYAALFSAGIVDEESPPTD